MDSKILGVGLIGCGSVAQTIHIPTLRLLSHLFRIAAFCDLSPSALHYVSAHNPASLVTTDPYELISNPNVQVVFVLSSHESHELYTIAALEAGKHVFVEKPLTLSLQSAQRIVQAEHGAPNGARVFVAYMRRYAPSFVSAFKREISSIDRILYVRSRDIIGPNEYFIKQSGTFPGNFTDLPQEAVAQAEERQQKLLHEAWKEKGRGTVTEEKTAFSLLLASLGSHDLSLLREIVGEPERVIGVSVSPPFCTALLQYKHDSHTFSATYETGITSVPVFDAHLTVYGMKKTVCIKYDTPFVKGLPIKVLVDEENEYGEWVHREIMSSYEDAYTAELQELHACLTEGKEIKTTATDACGELRVIEMLYDGFES